MRIAVADIMDESILGQYAKERIKMEIEKLLLVDLLISPQIHADPHQANGEPEAFDDK